jgi:SAM-dependent methyltransferase
MSSFPSYTLKHLVRERAMNYDAIAALYEAQYAHYRDDLHFYTRLAGDYGSPVLELGAGSARVSAALARAGHEVVAVELSSEMVRLGGERLEREGLAEQVRYRQADMRALKLDERFPLVILPFNAFMHAYTLADQDATLAVVKKHLAPRGLFALDLYNPNFGALEVLRREAEWDHVGGERAELFLYQSVDRDSQIIKTRYYLDTVREDGSLTRETATLTQRYYSRFELERALRQAGFEQLRFFGSFEKTRYTADASHLICLAR